MTIKELHDRLCPDDTLGEDALVYRATKAWRDAVARWPGDEPLYEYFRWTLAPDGTQKPGEFGALCRICNAELPTPRRALFADADAQRERNRFHVRQCLLAWYAEQSR